MCSPAASTARSRRTLRRTSTISSSRSNRRSSASALPMRPPPSPRPPRRRPSLLPQSPSPSSFSRSSCSKRRKRRRSAGCASRRPVEPMRRAALLLIVAALAGLAGTANADVFQVVPTESTAFVPPPPVAPEQLDYPQLLGLWQGAGTQYGVPWQVLAAINKVESNFGRNMGPSSAGAVGWMQFMPATWLEYGIDASGDGVADPWNAADAIYSAARYLSANGAASDLYGAVFQYNHADWYVNEVLGLAQLYGGDTTVAFSLDRLQQQLEAARRAVAAAGDHVQAVDNAVARWQRRADHA